MTLRKDRTLKHFNNSATFGKLQSISHIYLGSSPKRWSINVRFTREHHNDSRKSMEMKTMHSVNSDHCHRNEFTKYLEEAVMRNTSRIVHTWPVNTGEFILHNMSIKLFQINGEHPLAKEITSLYTLQYGPQIVSKRCQIPKTRWTFHNPYSFRSTLIGITAEHWHFCAEKEQRTIQKATIHLFLNSTKMKVKKSQTSYNL